jgi:hypothetical protein
LLMLLSSCCSPTPTPHCFCGLQQLADYSPGPMPAAGCPRASCPSQ